jgi:hypothetical protein
MGRCQVLKFKSHEISIWKSDLKVFVQGDILFMGRYLAMLEVWSQR